REIEATTSVIRKIPLRSRRNAPQSHILSRTKTPRLSRWPTPVGAEHLPLKNDDAKRSEPNGEIIHPVFLLLPVIRSKSNAAN
ncbi:MAG: hypothetical protein WC003_04100, partial [Terrimicrobiaceae bacterium]